MSTSSTYELVHTERLILRRPQWKDKLAVFNIHASPETNRHNPAGPMKDLKEAENQLSQWIDDWAMHGVGYWCVSALDNRESVIGVSGVRVMEWLGRPVLNLYFRYAPEVWGKGYATEVAKEAVEAAHDHLPEFPVVARTRPTNISSMRIAERVGLIRRPDLDTKDHVVYVSWW